MDLKTAVEIEEETHRHETTHIVARSSSRKEKNNLLIPFWYGVEKEEKSEKIKSDVTTQAFSGKLALSRRKYTVRSFPDGETDIFFSWGPLEAIT